MIKTLNGWSTKRTGMDVKTRQFIQKRLGLWVNRDKASRGRRLVDGFVTAHIIGDSGPQNKKHVEVEELGRAIPSDLSTYKLNLNNDNGHSKSIMGKVQLFLL